MTKNKRKKKFIGTSLQKKILILVIASALIPAGIVATCLYYLIFNMLAWQLGIPEAIAYNLIPVLKKINLIILTAMPVILLIIWIIALELSHRIAGPLSRIERELDSRLSGEASGPIKLRKKDEFRLLADKINKLMAKK